ncbi:MAG: endosialidase, partial [Lachnospiraceae bacterium]|nr:endosialidase [Lachnospiraceae bacterium]
DGDIYKVKTFNEITKLEKNGLFVYESVPGTAVNNLTLTDKGMSFVAEGADTEYKVFINDLQADKMKTNLSGKLVMSLELSEGIAADVRIEKIG